MTDDVLTFIENGVGRIRLNRPRAIHALTPGMCEAITVALLRWRTDPAVVAVMIDHAEGRGFCAGGDIALIANSAKDDYAEAEHFFRVEYRMNHLLFVYEKPIVAFMDGITMGGGVGLSLPARYRVATERTLFAMPETGIGLFPDVGGGWFLPRLPGRIGAWLATTGSRIDGADARAVGLATHYMASGKLDGVKAAIIAAPADLAAILDAAEDVPPPSKLATQRADIDRLFASDHYEDILAALRADGSQWASRQLSVLATKSPQTIKVALRQLAEGLAFTDFADNMRNEYRLACHVIRRPDFAEGVRAVIFDKDNAPGWEPATAEGVTDALVDSLFAPLPADREWTPLPELSAEQGESFHMSYETILVEQRDAVTLITLNRPQALNALNQQVLADLIDAFGKFDADPSQTCAVLTGSEKAFAAGADIKEMADKPMADFFLQDFFAGWTSRVTATRKPWIAAVAGFALGGGCELAMMADFIIAADTAKFGQPEIKLGVAPGMGGSQRLTRAVGKAKAMEMCLTGRMMGAEEAERAGLVARIVPAAEMLDDALKTAATIAGMPPLAALINKEMVNLAFETGLAQGMLTERRLFQILTATEDKAEGMAAFVEKRPGVWKGR